jgi:hypothetical protein
MALTRRHTPDDLSAEDVWGKNTGRIDELKTEERKKIT